jgi:hypothetical protein
VQLDLLDLLDQQVRQVLPEKRDLLDLLDLLEKQVLPAAQDLRDQLGQQVRRDQLEKPDQLE